MRFFKKSVILIPAILVLSGLALFNEVSAEDIILNDLNGKTVNLSSAIGKPVILFFWTTWCPYCRQEMKILNQMYPQMKKEGITVFAVNIGESAYTVEKFFLSHPVGFKVLLDINGAAADKYNVIGVPTFIFMNKSGCVISDEHTLPVDYKKLLFK